MKRLVLATPLSAEINHISNELLDAEGTCTCGRVLRRLDAKLVMMTCVPSKSTMIAAAYCLPCASQINGTLKSLRKVMYSGDTEVAPIQQ